MTLTLQTMSHLASVSLIDIQTQVALLMTHLDSDPRRKVKVVVLQELQKLAKKAPHLWSFEHVQVDYCLTLKKNMYSSVLTRPRGYKTFFMLNSAKHEISTAHKY